MCNCPVFLGLHAKIHFKSLLAGGLKGRKILVFAVLSAAGSSAADTNMDMM